jgi:hypothetical protein
MASRATALETLDSFMMFALKGEQQRVLELTVPDAHGTVQRVGRAISLFSNTPSYRLEPLESPGGEKHFVIHLESPTREVKASAVLRQVRSSWRITDLALLPGFEEMLRTLNAKEALRYACEAALRGDSIEFADLLTSAAFVDMMRLTSAWGLLPVPDSYAIDELPAEGDKHLFMLTLHSGSHQVEALTSVEQLDEDWKITSIKMAGLAE